MNEKQAKMLLGRRIKKLRMERGLTQGKASEKSGNITEKRLSDIECGMYAVGLNTLIRMAKGLGVPVYELLKFEETETERKNKAFVKNKIFKLEEDASKMSKEMITLKKNINQLRNSIN